MNRQTWRIAVGAALLFLGAGGSPWAVAQSTHYSGCLECVEARPRHCEWLTGPCSEVCEQQDYAESGHTDCIQGEVWGGIYVCGTYGGDCSSVGGDGPPQPD